MKETIIIGSKNNIIKIFLSLNRHREYKDIQTKLWWLNPPGRAILNFNKIKHLSMPPLYIKPLILLYEKRKSDSHVRTRSTPLKLHRTIDTKRVLIFHNMNYYIIVKYQPIHLTSYITTYPEIFHLWTTHVPR